MTEPMLQIWNHHSENCGDPPTIRGGDPNVYIGYFENCFGEQWVFTYHRETKQAVLRGGDVEWNVAYQVKGGFADGLVLSAEEVLWLRACWRAATGE